jgi:hypothetical protein
MRIGYLPYGIGYKTGYLPYEIGYLGRSLRLNYQTP